MSNRGGVNNLYHEGFCGRVKEQIGRAIDEFESDDFEVFDSYHEQLESFAKDYGWCPYMQLLPVIGADQNVYSCQDKAYNLECGLLGSIKDCGFGEFWQAGKGKFFKISPLRDCNHHCVADGKNRLLLNYLNADKEHMAFV